MVPTRSDLRNAALCGAAAVLVLAATWPVADTPCDDDWSYSFTVKRLAETGHLLYNGWSSPSIITQAYYALPWVRAFGFSFQALRLSTAPVAAAAVGLTYLLGRRAGLDVRWAVFAAALLGTSPVFLPMATSFMTDVPGVLCLLASAYAAAAAAEAAGRRSAAGWVAASVVAGAVGGASRQIDWLAPLVLLPYAAWVRRGDRPFVAGAGLAWAGTLAAAVAVQRWFERQPYSLPEPSAWADLSAAWAAPAAATGRFAGLLLTAAVLVLPAGTATGRRGTAGRAVAVFVGIVLVASLIGPAAWAPWMGNVVTPSGVMATFELFGRPPVVLGWAARVPLTLAVFAAVAALAARATAGLGRPAAGVASARAFFLHPPAGRATVPGLVLLSLAYLGTLLTRCATAGVLFDRHLLAMIPCLAIPLLATCPPRGPRATRAAWAGLAAFAAFGIGTTHDELARSRAVATAVAELRAAGVRPEHLDGGFEFDSWTELAGAGHVNDPRVTVPPGAYRPDRQELAHFFAQYRVAYEPLPDTVPAAGGTVGYLTLVPPRREQVYIGRIVRPVRTARP